MLENKNTFLTTRVFSPRATHIKASLFPFVRLILFSSLFQHQHQHRHWHSNTNNHKKELPPPSLQTKRPPITIIMRLQLSCLIVAALARLAMSLPGSEISDITLRSLPCCQVNNQACDEPSKGPVSSHLTYTTWPTYLTTLPVYLLSARKQKKKRRSIIRKLLITIWTYLSAAFMYDLSSPLLEPTYLPAYLPYLT